MESKRILIADDVPANLAYLEAVLQGAGFVVDCAANGADAIESALLHKPCLIVSDILMPEMDGFALCRIWKNEPALRSIPFVFYTGTYVDDKDRQLAQSLGCDAFLVKPLEPGELLAAVENALRSSSRRPDAPPPPNDEFLRQYNESLVRKLEDKMQQLERKTPFAAKPKMPCAKTNPSGQSSSTPIPPASCSSKKLPASSPRSTRPPPP